MGIWLGGQQSFEPYGYLCLGLAYHWNNEKAALALKNLVLVKVDIALRKNIWSGLYSDRFERPADEVTFKGGIHYYEDLPIVNYDMLNIPEQIDEFINEEKEELFFDEELQKTKPATCAVRKLKHSVNRTCVPSEAIYDGEYKELYSCVLDYNKWTREGYLVGFDVLGKILERSFCLKGMDNDDNIRRALLKDMAWFEWESESAYAAKQKEYGFLNFDYRLNKAGKLTCRYNSIWKVY